MTAPGASPERRLVVLHGIYGRGRNWASIANALCARRPDLAVELVDLRLHGDSAGFDPPHDLFHAAEDVADLIDPDVVAVLGHSFGGKVALALPRTVRSALVQIWVVDASPSAHEPDGESMKMLGKLRALPATFERREDLVAAMVADGVAEAVANWMATNLRAIPGGGYRFGLDLDGIKALLRSYFLEDLWGAIEERVGAEIDLVKANRNSALSAEDVTRFTRAAANDAGVRLHSLDGGHWLHVDNPGGLVELLATSIPTRQSEAH